MEQIEVDGKAVEASSDYKVLSTASKACTDLARGYEILKQIYSRYDLFAMAERCSKTEQQLRDTSKTLCEMVVVERITEDFFKKKSQG